MCSRHHSALQLSVAALLEINFWNIYSVLLNIRLHSHSWIFDAIISVRLGKTAELNLWYLLEHCAHFHFTYRSVVAEVLAKNSWKISIMTVTKVTTIEFLPAHHLNITQISLLNALISCELKKIESKQIKILKLILLYRLSISQISKVVNRSRLFENTLPLHKDFFRLRAEETFLQLQLPSSNDYFKYYSYNRSRLSCAVVIWYF